VRPDHRIAVAVRHECRDAQNSQSLEQSIIGDPSAADGVVLRLTRLPRSRLVAVPRSSEDAPGGLLSGGAAAVGRGEEHGDVPLRGRLRCTDGADDLRRPTVHPGRALRCGRGEHDAAQYVGADERDLLGDEAADGKAEQVDALEVHRFR